MRHDPISDLFSHYGAEPGPLDEIKMWERQLGRLHSILKQLESPVAKDILQNLDSAQSQYSSSFNHVRKDVNKVDNHCMIFLLYGVANVKPSFTFQHIFQWFSDY